MSYNYDWGLYFAYCEGAPEFLKNSQLGFSSCRTITLTHIHIVAFLKYFHFCLSYIFFIIIHVAVSIKQTDNTSPFQSMTETGAYPVVISGETCTTVSVLVCNFWCDVLEHNLSCWFVRCYISGRFCSCISLAQKFIGDMMRWWQILPLQNVPQCIVVWPKHNYSVWNSTSGLTIYCVSDHSNAIAL